MFSPQNKGLIPTKGQIIHYIDGSANTTSDILLTLELCGIRKYKLFPEI